MSTMPPVEPLKWALEQAEQDGLRGEALLVRTLEVAIAISGQGGEAIVRSVRDALAQPKPGFRAPDDQLARARELVALLEPLSPVDRLSTIAGSRRKYRGVAVAEAFLARAWAALPAEGADSGSWAECGFRAARFTVPRDSQELDHLVSLMARGLALLANSSRIACDLRRAESVMIDAVRTIEFHPVMDLATRAEVLEFSSVLQRAQRRTTEAVDNLRWCAAVWEILGRTNERARVLTTLVMTLQIAGRPEEALAAAHEGLAVSAALDNKRMLWHLRHNEFEILDELGRIEEARTVAAEAHRLAAPFEDSFTRLRLTWLDGRLARSEGRKDEAAEMFRAAQAGFLAEKNSYVAAMVSLDLTELHLEAGHYAEAAELATAMAATFDALGVQREAYAACWLFADACERGRASVTLARHLSRYLDQARQDPEYGFPAAALLPESL